jgi:hypothetical protein
MKTFIQLSLLAILSTGCIVVPGRYHHPHGHGAVAIRRDCPPSYHWDGYACVHNGHGRGKGNGNGRR